jgi:CheY-like chemotaxis protein
METPLNPEQRDYVNTIRTSGEALLTIINDILDFSKIESGKMEIEHTALRSLALPRGGARPLRPAGLAKQARAHLPRSHPDVPRGSLWATSPACARSSSTSSTTPSSSPPAAASPSSPSSPSRRALLAGTQTDALQLEFTVRDTGIGIPPTGSTGSSRPSRQVDSSTTRKYGGTGLGLAICQRLSALMGGDIRVESEPGGGTAFIFTIRTTAATGTSESGLATAPLPLRGGWILCVEDHPVTQARLRTLCETWRVDCVIVPTAAAALAAAHSHAQPPALVVVDTGDAMDLTSPLTALAPLGCPMMALYPFGQTPPAAPDGCNQFGSTTKPLRTISFVLGVAALFQSSDRYRSAASTGADRPLGDEVPLEVLVAEDNAVNQKVALRFLERLGYRADTVANGLEAVTTLEHRRYDLVLMDLQMPEMDGFEATRQIRRRVPAHRQPKIIALTANAMQGDREQCFAAGMDDHISKPVKMDEIAETIRKHFPRAECATKETEASG